MPDSTDNKTCVPGLIDQEQLYFLALNDASQYLILGNILTIFYDEGKQVLVYEGTQIGLAQKRPLTNLQGTDWYLWTINDEPILNGSTITADFTINPDDRSGKMNGSAGCNKYQAIFGEDLGMQTTLNSNETCALPIGVMEQERLYLQVLSRAYGYWLTDDQLIVNTGGGALSYRMAPPPQSGDQTHLLQQHTWFLVSYNTSLSAPGGQGDPNLRFSLDNSLSGYTGCNILSGRYTTDLNKITISDLTQTQEPCPNTVLAAQEKAIMDVLRSAQTYQVIDTSMQLVGSAGVLNYFFAPVNRPEDVVPPTAVITAPIQAKVGEVVVFDASKSTSQVPITSYSWEFGDGGKARGEVVRYVYENPGTYLVQMTVTDARNFRNSATMNIEILPLVEPTQEPTPEPTAPPEATPEPTQPPEVTPEPTAEPTQPPAQVPPQAAIQGPGSGFPGEPVVFNALASQPGSGPIVSYQWDFGDGTNRDTADQAMATTLYNHSGTYDVTVLVTDQNGLSDSATMQVVIDARLDTEVWDLYELMDEPLVPGTAITLQFLEGAVTGFSGCNSYAGNYIAEENEDGTYNVTIEDLQITQIGCPEAIMKQEALYLGLLTSVQVAQIEGNELRLSYPAGIDPDGQDYPAGELLFYELGTAVPF
jgi:heat shock protein HslJ